jgi:hypothetical protein
MGRWALSGGPAGSRGGAGEKAGTENAKAAQGYQRYHVGKVAQVFLPVWFDALPWGHPVFVP